MLACPARRRYNTELGEFRLWCKVADAAVTRSGVEADEVLNDVTQHRRPTTHLFWQAGYATKAMSVPPWRISGASATSGGVGNSLARQGACASTTGRTTVEMEESTRSAEAVNEERAGNRQPCPVTDPKCHSCLMLPSSRFALLRCMRNRCITLLLPMLTQVVVLLLPQLKRLLWTMRHLPPPPLALPPVHRLHGLSTCRRPRRARCISVAAPPHVHLQPHRHLHPQMLAQALR